MNRWMLHGVAGFFLCLGAASTLADSAPSIDQIVAGHIAGLGGQEKLRAVESLKISGTQNFNGIDAKVTIYRQRPNLFRMEIAGERGLAIQAYDGESGWSQGYRRGTTGPTPMDEADTQTLLDELADFDGPLIDHAAKGHEVTWSGETDVDGEPAHHLRLTLASGKTQDWFLTKDGFTLVKKITPQIHSRAGEYQRIWYFLEHQEVEGLRIPFYQEREDRQHVRALTLDSVEINPEIPSDLFRMPTG